MMRAFRYNRQESGAGRPMLGYFRWMRFWAEALAHALHRRTGCAVWAEDAAAELLLRGFPSLLAVPAPLFRASETLFPARCRLAAAGKDEEELLAAVRTLERRAAARFDWDAFLAACGRQSRRARLLHALAAALDALSPPEPDAASPQAAMRAFRSWKG